MTILFYIMIILVGAISWKPIIPGIGGQVLTLTKGLLLIIVLFYILERGIRKNNISIINMIGIFVLTLFLIIQIVRVNYVEYADYGDITRSFSAYLLLFLIPIINFRLSEAKRILIIIQLLPIISVITGIIFSIFTQWNFIKHEYTGVMRIQGSNPPAHLAELCFVAIITSLACIQYNERKVSDSDKVLGINKMWVNLLLYINLFILTLTFTRITLLGALLLYGFYIMKKIYKSLKRKRISLPILLLLIFSGIPLLYAIKQILESLIERSTNNLGGINTSGRYWAWQYFKEKAMEHPIIGRGMGASQSLYETNPHKEFVAPHNEFIRAFLEVGTIGCIIIIFFLIFYIIWCYKKNKKYEIIKNSFFILTVISIFIVSYYDNLFVTIHFSLPFTLLCSCYISIIMNNADRSLKHEKNLIN